jgi:hypothetical protein
MVIVGVIFAAMWFGLNYLFSKSQTMTNLPKMATTTSNSVIALENEHLGTTNWQIPIDKVSTVEIQAYANATSVLPGQLLTFYVSTQYKGTPYSIMIYRLGWYGGTGGRLMTSLVNELGQAQGYYDLTTHHLVGCTSCLVDSKTGLVEARWHPSYKLTIPAHWVTGVYLAKFTDDKGMQTYTPFDVQGNFHSRYVVVTSNTTYQAYNEWGGYSLYTSNDKRLKKAVKVSFDRPYIQGEGSGDLLSFEVDAIHWLERQGYDLSYISGVDIHQNPAQILNHRAYLSIGHDEYWSKEMFDGIQYARDSGVGLAFLGANADYWQTRFESDSANIPNRTIVCYKVQTSEKDLARDPLYGKDNSRVTTRWRDPLLARPENALVGIMYSSYSKSHQGFPWRVSPQVKSPFLKGTGLQKGQEYGCGLVGYEWDRIFNNGDTPEGLQVLAESFTTTYHHLRDVSDTTYYVASSDALVFATGSIYWARALDGYRLYSTHHKQCANQNPVVPGVQKLMANIMDALVVRQTSQ